MAAVLALAELTADLSSRESSEYGLYRTYQALSFALVGLRLRNLWSN